MIEEKLEAIDEVVQKIGAEELILLAVFAFLAIFILIGLVIKFLGGVGSFADIILLFFIVVILVYVMMCVSR